MASRGSIISGAKSIPGGARPTPAPQGLTAPYQGNFSPLTQDLTAGGAAGTWGGAYNGYLPRPTETFTNGAFGPFSPILPVPVDAPEPGSEFPDPRLFQYEVGWNLPTGQPGSEGIKMADFNTLRTLADLYSVARSCIQLRKAEIRGIEWDIMPSHDASKAMRGDRDAMKDFGERRSEAMKFFRRPDPDYFSWTTFIDAFLEEIFVFDALSVLFRMKWAKGKGKGLLGSDLDSLSLINGPTIRPLLDLQGAKPRPPAPAYQQYLYGVPRCDLMTLITGRDLDDGMLSGADMKRFQADQLLYLPMNPRRWTPYGFPPIERALVPVMSGLQKQGYQLDYFREGTVPAVYISPGGVNANMTPNQIRELQDALNAIAGDPAWKHKIIVLPADSKVMPQRQQELADQFDEIVMNQVCMAFDVQPMELGIMPKVSTTVSPGAGNQMAKASQGIHERKATKPTLTFIADIMNAVLQDVCGQDDMRFVFEGLEEQEDEATKTTMLISQIGAGLRSIDEARDELSLQPWGLPETSDPGWTTAAGGWVPLAEAAQARQTHATSGDLLELPAGTAAAPETGAQPPAEGSDGAKPVGSKPPAKKPAKKPAAGSTGNAGQSPGHDAAEAGDTEAGKAKPSAGDKKPATKGVSSANAQHQARRNGVTSGAISTVVDRLNGVVDRHLAGTISTNDALDAAVNALATGYRIVMTTAARHARADHGFTKKLFSAWVTKAEGDEYAYSDGSDGDEYGFDEMSGEATTRAENQRKYLAGLLAQAASGAISRRMTDARLDLYGQTLTGAYNSAYGQTMQANGDYTITWVLGASEHCKPCLSRDGKTYTFHSLPGWPGDGGFSGPGSICAGGANCHCSLEYSEAGTVLATASNTQLPGATGYYADQLSDITARRDRAEQARSDFLATVPEPARARAQNRDDIRREMAEHANARIRAGGGYGGISTEPADIPAGDVAHRVLLNASKSRAVFSELEALGRHMKKGRLISTWESRHIDNATLARIAENSAKGMDTDTAIRAATAARRVGLNGQEYWDVGPDVTVTAYIPAGGGGPTMVPHDANGIPTPNGQATVKGDGHDGDHHGDGPDVSPNGDIASKVYDYLTIQYPPKVLGWVKKAQWRGPAMVSLTAIDMARRPGSARNMDHVNAIAEQIRNGNEPGHPVVLVDTPGPGKLEIADGWHRTLATEKAGQEQILAWIGVVDSPTGPWGAEMNDAKLVPNGQTAKAAGTMVDKSSVNYRPATVSGKSCGTCSMFRSPHACALVKGVIQPADTCDEWEAKDDG